MNKADLGAYLPEFMRKIAEYKALFAVEKNEFSALDEALRGLLAEAFFDSLSIEALVKWEKLFALSVKEGESLFMRRLRVKSRFAARIPYTEKSLRRLLDALLGEERYTLLIDCEENRVQIGLKCSEAALMTETSELLREILPAHLLLMVFLLYNRWSKIRQLTWGEAKALCWRELKEKEL